MNPNQGRVVELSRLFRLDSERTEPWPIHELAAMFQHQLAAVPGDEFRAWDESALGPTGGSENQPETGPPSFRELFQQASPNVAWLDLAKQYAKASAADGRLPREIAAVLYLSAIAAASVHAGTRITELDSAELNAKLNWALSQPWLDEQIGQLLRKALAS